MGGILVLITKYALCIRLSLGTGSYIVTVAEQDARYCQKDAVQIYLNRITSPCCIESIRIMSQAAFPGIESIQLTTQVLSQEWI